MGSRSRTLIVIVGALVYALVGFRILLSSATSVVVDTRQYAGEFNGSGGLGAVSIGVSEITLLYALLVLASVVANWMLRSWARGSDRAVKVLYRIHRWTIVLPFVLVILVPVAFFALPGPLGLLFLAMSGVAWGVQFLSTAALLGMYALRTSRT
jgi:hypothetical protein